MTTIPVACLFLLLWIASPTHAQTNGTDPVDSSVGNNMTNNATVPPAPFGTCFRAIGDALRCGKQASCTCYENVSLSFDSVTKNFIKTNQTCPDMTKQVCDLIDQTKGCCTPCEAVFARLTLCEGETTLIDCPSAQQCLSTGIASAANTHFGFSSFLATAVAISLAFCNLII